MWFARSPEGTPTAPGRKSHASPGGARLFRRGKSDAVEIRKAVPSLWPQAILLPALVLLAQPLHSPPLVPRQFPEFPSQIPGANHALVPQPVLRRVSASEASGSASPFRTPWPLDLRLHPAGSLPFLPPIPRRHRPVTAFQFREPRMRLATLPVREVRKRGTSVSVSMPAPVLAVLTQVVKPAFFSAHAEIGAGLGEAS